MRTQDELRISMLGGFVMTRQAKGNTYTVSDQSSSSKKLWQFLQYLVTYRARDGIPQAEIIDVLWNDENGGNPANSLKTLLHRVRNLMETLGYPDGKDIILYRRGVYSINRSLPIWVDIEEFEHLYQQTRVPTANRLSLLMTAISLYKGEFLPKTADATWSVSEKSYYHSKYLQMCEDAVALYEADGKFNEIISLVRQALTVAPYEEPLHLALLRALAATGAQQTAITHYINTAKLFMDQLGITPSEEFTGIYRELIRMTRAPELDLSVVRKDLTEQPRDGGPYFCELAIFQEFYHFEARVAQRTGTVLQLALLSVLDNNDKPLSQKQNALAMQRLKDIILSLLRKGDVFCRYSSSQFLFLLPYATYEGGESVLNRLCFFYRRTYQKSNIILHYSVLPLQPMDAIQAEDEKIPFTHIKGSVEYSKEI